MAIDIVEVKTKRQLREFIEFPNQLYRSEPNYVPVLYLSEKWVLSKKNPFLQHSQIAMFLAKENNTVVGRIVSIYNKTHLDVYKDNTGFFGFFDSINNIEVAQALFQTSFLWLKSKGLSRMMGPTNLTTNDSCGILVDGFNQPPMILMPYNFEYYNNLFLDFGLKKTIDLFSYEIDGTAVVNKYANVLERSLRNLENNNIKIRSISKNSFDDDVAKLQYVYNKCNEHNWGFMPLNVAEFRAMAKDLKMIAPLDLAIVVEKDSEIIGFIIAIPDLNQAFKHMSNGKLFPFGIFKLMWYKRKIKKARILILGLLDEYSRMGIDLMLYQKIKDALNNHNIYTSEACYVIESNQKMNSILNKIDGKKIKTYRIYMYDGNKK